MTCGVVVVAMAAWLAVPPGRPFPDDYSTLVFDARGGLLRAALASDQQYRFPLETGELSPKYVAAVVASEDKRFFSHPGADPLALASAAAANLRAGKRVRGGSTITMQVSRLANPKRRTYVSKAIECVDAVRLSLHFSKRDVLAFYAGHVPMGGNVVGVQAASYLYCGKSASELTWAEAALFAVLPNAPSMINLERERPSLFARRNALLDKLYRTGSIDDVTRVTARGEPLPDPVKSLPFGAPHFTQYVASTYPDRRVIRTTLDGEIQEGVVDAARRHHAVLGAQGIRNLSVLVVETRTGKIRAYVGSQDFEDADHGGQVDGVRARRSTGSLLKPFLVAKALDRGPYTMLSRIQDIPTFYGTFAPQNSSKEFSGLASLQDVLVQSLNVPSVRLLNAYGVHDFYDFLVNSGFKGLFRDADGYGLSLILGGAEASLLELTQLYIALGNMGRSQPLVAVQEDTTRIHRKLSDTQRKNPPASRAAGDRLFTCGSAWLVLETLTRPSRPGIEYYSEYFDHRVPVAWKTGTSYGQKDAWAIGVNAQWTIGVWAGNFTGEGNATLTGHASAAPLLFSLFNMLERDDEPAWFDEPYQDLADVECCAESGFPAGPCCPETVHVKRPQSSYASGVCPYHRRYLVDKETGRQVCSLCWKGVETEWVTRFVVPPAAREIFARTGRHADEVPVHSSNCSDFRDEHQMELVYPVDGIKIFVPRDFDGVHERIVFTAKHQRPSTHLFWYLNGSLVGETVDIHECAVDLFPGDYTLTVEDEDGFSRTANFRAYRKEG
jgi:penicillin-binding protein 1C